MKRACKDCEFYAFNPTLAGPQYRYNGFCRRAAPRGADAVPWAGVRSGDWCGEFQLRGLECNTYDTIKKLSRCFAELSMEFDKDVPYGLEDFASERIELRLHKVLADVNGIIDLPAVVDELKKEQER